MSTTNAQIAALSMHVDIAASPSAVWRALTADIGAWWPAEFYAGGEAGARDYRLEATPGGRMMEQWDDGGGVLWGTVVTVQPEKKLQVLGSTFPDFGGPVQWFGTWSLSAHEGGTRLRFDEHTLGKVSDAGQAEKDKGWRFLWSVLGAHLEGRPAPAWPD